MIYKYSSTEATIGDLSEIFLNGNYEMKIRIQ